MQVLLDEEGGVLLAVASERQRGGVLLLLAVGGAEHSWLLRALLQWYQPMQFCRCHPGST